MSQRTHDQKLYDTLKPQHKRPADYFSAENIAARKAAERDRILAERRCVFAEGQGQGFRQFFHEDEDPIFFVQRGDNRASFNLGEGCRHRRRHMPTS